ncbi:hypothetical protein [Frankia sp. AvcI1]|uniref:hypothetical protein n=1 Tax=Frankia sp. AvcI1 TaxID=573496 RepID=UPI00211757F9|nr:hypothetical protein [Frankia sp. AvcI1]
MGELLNGQVERLMARTVDAEDEVRRLRARVAELTERAETAEQIVQARDEILGEWLGKVERAAEVERRADAAEAAVQRVQQAIDWLAGILATSARDWSTSHDLALIYGVILGWHDPSDPDDDGGALGEIKALFAHGPGFIDRMQEHRATVRALAAAGTPADATSDDASAGETEAGKTPG